ncbi:MAG: hypothetical protein JXA44_05605 [Methanospirillaceae archaeon]|nr:hypothetical protein [Methanospirillaceae archaeon]
MKFDTWYHATKPGIRIIKTVTKNRTGVIRWIMNAHARADCFIVMNYLFQGLLREFIPGPLDIWHTSHVFKMILLMEVIPGNREVVSQDRKRLQKHSYIHIGVIETPIPVKTETIPN